MVQAQMTIPEWLAGSRRDYHVGLGLYAGVRHNRNVLKMLQRKESKANMDKLVYELGKFAPRASAHEAPHTHFVEDVAELDSGIKQALSNVSAVFIAGAEENRDRLMFHDLPAEMRPVLLEKNQAFARMAFLKIELNALAPEKEREAFQIQTEIVELQKKRDLCWKKLDYWLQHRDVPEAESGDFADFTPEQKVKRQQLLFASISKLKSRVSDYERQLASDLPVNVKFSVERKLVKSKKNLLSKESELLELTNLIEGR
ncbi:hypothetical protein [Flavobacterium sp.]|uniref:hypothetical protein n=1 Tax=Flavobacterium sp. TaxID=239 RepID=UPI0011F99E7D|nr:hypothetical protein [Flavobacterium sp.]RZJ71086.1 MAG: hypothetical protein EOO49_11575 [Flavobacterium sp.]